MNVKEYNNFALLFSHIKKVHIIGAGGVGMSALGLFLIKKYKLHVSGSDRNNSDYLKTLEKTGATVWIGSHPHRIDKQSIVFYSSAILSNDLERKYCVDNQIPVYNRNYLLQYITKEYFTIAICGTHGKTTTTGWIVDYFIRKDINISYIVGGKIIKENSHAAVGSYKRNEKPVLVIEADESDKSFLWISANIILITNIELDHLENFSHPEEVFASFQKFVQNNVSNNCNVLFSIQNSSELVNMYFPHFYEDYKQILQRFQIDISNNSISYNNISYALELKGRHNIYNASLVVQLSELISKQKSGWLLKENSCKESLQKFTGMGRRLEKIFSAYNLSHKKIEILDDYAHHPTEVKEVLDTVISYFSKDLYIFWEPHRIERLHYFFDDFLSMWNNFFLWKRLVILPIFTARVGRENLGVYQDIYKRLQKFYKKCQCILTREKETLDYLDNASQKFAKERVASTVIFLGAGKSSFYANYLKEKLAFAIENASSTKMGNSSRRN